MRRSSSAGYATRMSGTTSRALNTEPQARATVGVPEKYRWWSVPMMPPARKIVAESKDASAANRAVTRFRRQKKKAITVVAKTSKNPFHPQVNHPPAPVFHNRQMGVLSPGQTRTVEQSD